MYLIFCDTLSDINECETTDHGCEHGCVDIDGSYICTCITGFYLNENGRNCNGTLIFIG